MLVILRILIAVSFRAAVSSTPLTSTDRRGALNVQLACCPDQAIVKSVPFVNRVSNVIKFAIGMRRCHERSRNMSEAKWKLVVYRDKRPELQLQNYHRAGYQRSPFFPL